MKRRLSDKLAVIEAGSVWVFTERMKKNERVLSGVEWTFPCVLEGRHRSDVRSVGLELGLKPELERLGRGRGTSGGGNGVVVGCAEEGVEEDGEVGATPRGKLLPMRFVAASAVSSGAADRFSTAASGRSKQASSSSSAAAAAAAARKALDRLRRGGAAWGGGESAQHAAPLKDS